MPSSNSNASRGTWSIQAGLATWSAGTATPNVSYNLTVPNTALLFSVATPATRTKEFSVTATLAQLGGAGTYSTFTGKAASKDKLKISTASGVVTDDLFTNFVSVEQLTLQGSGGYTVTLGPLAQAAGIRDVEGGAGADLISASAYTTGIEIEAESGNDTLVGGQGNDELEGGRGADQIDLTAGGRDRVKYESNLDGSSVGVSGQSFSGCDTITGFTSGDDKIDIDYSFAAVKAVTKDPGFDLANVDAVVSAMNAAIATDTLVAGRNVIFAINDGTLSAVYSATVIDSDLVTAGVQAAVSNPYMLASVNTPLVSGDII